MIVNLSSSSFDEIVTFLFDHATRESEDDTVSERWYFDAWPEVTITARQAVEFLTNLFERGPELLQQFTDDQIDQGFWCIFSFAHAYFADHLWNPELPWPKRRRCIAATVSLYERLFETRSLEDAAWMFWDWLTFSYEIQQRDPARSAEDARVQDAMFEALRTLLTESSRGETQRAALHGLSHLRHRDTARLIAGYLAVRPRDPELIKYAQRIQSGKSTI